MARFRPGDATNATKATDGGRRKTMQIGAATANNAASHPRGRQPNDGTNTCGTSQAALGQTGPQTMTQQRLETLASDWRRRAPSSMQDDHGVGPGRTWNVKTGADSA